DGATKLGEDLTIPYSFDWTNCPRGDHSLTVRAVFNSGFTLTSSAVKITVVTNVPPTVEITNPTRGAFFVAPATVTLSALASDADGTVTNVEFFAPGKVGEVRASPFSLTISNVSAGHYTLTSKATDDSGEVSAAARVN